MFFKFINYFNNNNIYNTNNTIFNINIFNNNNTKNYIQKPKTQEPQILMQDPRALSLDTGQENWVVTQNPKVLGPDIGPISPES